MRQNQIVAIILALLIFVGFYFFYHGGSSSTASPSADALQISSSSPQSQSTVSTATNFDECIAEGNRPLPDAPDKCLTKDGHVFIQGIVEP